MRISIFLVILYGFICLSCNSQVKSSTEQKKRNTIQLNDMSDQHPNKQDVIFFLNNYTEAFFECNELEYSFKEVSLVEENYQFCMESLEGSVMILFFESQRDALRFADVNAEQTEKKCTVNGGVLYVVNGTDEEQVSSLLYYFSGEE